MPFVFMLCLWVIDSLLIEIILHHVQCKLRMIKANDLSVLKNEFIQHAGKD